MAKRTSLRPADWTWADNVNHDIGVRVDDTIWVSGMVAFEPDADVVAHMVRPGPVGRAQGRSLGHIASSFSKRVRL